MWEIVQVVCAGLTFCSAVRMFRYGTWLGVLAGLILTTMAVVVLGFVFNGPAKQGGTF